MIEEVGETAGEIWNLLNEKGELSLSGVQSNSTKTRSLVNMGIGWLLREDKITMSKGERGIRISLK
ncbi:MAG: winged helix-turn-helix domain-containing protein [Halobacteriota archaeon]|nr:winged helix-turn-helix domain-containing protein [Halobacteriota archaeon]